MKTWLADFSARFEEALHRLLWQQWTLLGVAGSGFPGAARAPLDPEALLLLTLESARTEPRLFDEVLDWLRRHGNGIDVQRLRNLLREDPEAPTRLVSAAAAFAGEEITTPKWRRLATPPRKPPAEPEPLFLLPGNRGMADSAVLNTLFVRHGYRRHPIKLRELTGPIPIRLAATLRFRLRGMFGIGIRAEALNFLISGGSGNVNEISRVACYSRLGTLQAVRELAQSETVIVRLKGREKIYRADAIRWWEFLGIEERVSPGRLVRTADGLAYEDTGVRTSRDPKGRVTGGTLAPPITWVDWKTYFRGMAVILRFLRSSDIARMTSYVADSQMDSTFMLAEADYLSAVEAPFRPPMPLGNPQEYGEIILKSLAMAAGDPVPKVSP